MESQHDVCDKIVRRERLQYRSIIDERVPFFDQIDFSNRAQPHDSARMRNQLKLQGQRAARLGELHSNAITVHNRSDLSPSALRELACSMCDPRARELACLSHLLSLTVPRRSSEAP